MHFSLSLLHLQHPHGGLVLVLVLRHIHLLIGCSSFAWLGFICSGAAQALHRRPLSNDGALTGFFAAATGAAAAGVAVFAALLCKME